MPGHRRPGMQAGTAMEARAVGHDRAAGMRREPARDRNMAATQGMPFPGPGGDGAAGGSGKAADFRNPLNAVNAFLDALKQRDADLLAESTALRAATESHVNNRKLFTSILDHSISDDDFDDLIEKLDGYQISFLNSAKSTGRQGIVLEKIVDNHTYRRTIEVRREKAGWKVVDVGGERDLSASVSGVRSKPRRRSADSPTARRLERLEPDPPRSCPPHVRGRPGEDPCEGVQRPTVPELP